MHALGVISIPQLWSRDGPRNPSGGESRQSIHWMDNEVVGNYSTSLVFKFQSTAGASLTAVVEMFATAHKGVLGQPWPLPMTAANMLCLATNEPGHEHILGLEENSGNQNKKGARNLYIYPIPVVSKDVVVHQAKSFDTIQNAICIIPYPCMPHLYHLLSKTLPST